MRVGRLMLLMLLAVLIALGVYLALTPGALNFARGATTITDEAQINERVVAFVTNPYTDDYSMLRVPGYVDNMSKSEFRAVTVEIQLLDGDGNKKEKITYVVNDVPAGARKTFDLNAGTLPADRTATVAVTKLEVYK